MIVPKYWAEKRLQHRDGKRQVTVRRFGWSDASQADAQASADTRAGEALQRILSGEKLLRRDPKIAYNGAEGVPIREEIVSEHGPTIITRNSYGARCLNTPNVFFADIDYQVEPSIWFTLSVFGVLLLCAFTAGTLAHSGLLCGIIGFGAIFVSSAIAGSLRRIMQRVRGGPERLARSRIDAFVAAHPGWNLRLYKTPAGLRVLATHQIFNPSEPVVAESLQAMGADPVYIRMCLNQHCFRARVTAKPWRAGITSHMRPRPGIWPIAPERMPIREAWVAEYEAAARSYAACSFVESIGSGVVAPEAKAVQQIHDALCSANSQLPLA